MAPEFPLLSKKELAETCNSLKIHFTGAARRHPEITNDCALLCSALDVIEHAAPSVVMAGGGFSFRSAEENKSLAFAVVATIVNEAAERGNQTLLDEVATVEPQLMRVQATVQASARKAGL